MEMETEPDLFTSGINELIQDTLTAIRTMELADDLYLLRQILTACRDAIEHGEDIEII